MNAHELAKLLLELPDLPIATHANRSTYLSGKDSEFMGLLGVGFINGDHIIIGNLGMLSKNNPNLRLEYTFPSETTVK